MVGCMRPRVGLGDWEAVRTVLEALSGGTVVKSVLMGTMDNMGITEVTEDSVVQADMGVQAGVLAVGRVDLEEEGMEGGGDVTDVKVSCVVL